MLRREKLSKILKYLTLTLTLAVGVFSNSSAFDDIGKRKNLFKIDEIVFKGLKKVEREAVLGKINSKVGMMLDSHLLKKDLERIYRLKYFESVEALREKSKGKNQLVFVVKEKPVISKILIEGNDEVDRDDLVAVLKTKEFSIVDVNTIKQDVEALQKYYEEKGFYLASVDYDINKVENDNVELTFEVKEFDKVRVKKITFLGIKAFSEDQLKGIMETREEELFSFMNNAGNFKEFNFQIDIERVKQFYRNKGFLQVNVGAPDITVSEDKRWVFITLKVNEGPKFTVNDIYFNGEVLFDEGKLLEELRMKSGSTYSEEILRADIQMLTEKYQDEGYAFANVLRTLDVVPGENKVNVEFSFEKGKIAHFGNIVIKGNTRSRDKVIRRELKIEEGMKFSGSKLRESKENVNRLGFFEPGSVIFNTVSVKGRDDLLDVEISVKEKNTGQISLGAGYSTATKGFIQASVTQNNFRGLGQSLSFTLNLSNTQQTFSLSFTEPYLFDSKWTAGGEIFSTKNEQLTSYDYKKVGFAARIGYPVFEYTRLFLTYKLEETTLSNIEDETINEEAENGITSSVRTALVKDKRDHRFEPTKGYYLSFATEYAGVGGEKKWWKNEADARWFKRVYGDLIFRSRLYTAKLETVNSELIPRNERFSLGGSRNLRGFTIEDIGPKKTIQVTEDGKTKDKTFNDGAQFTAYTTLELEHPLAREAGLKWVLFFDAGNAVDIDNFNKVYMDYGFGFRWFSPLGVLRFEFGFPINPDDEGEKGSQFHFDIGQLF
ncbi:outer membrane protein assembly factor BamA [Halobacteriovorax sp. GB3]|uniref:outer membrane protein assembly factor BamA n=1 Tax=Halobacteriovorax sp. GB3 TaxID=2719615 RepID=UPI00235EA272|nr:outer membrane protein assembly factor BamA [Halobacteriovorax sp. GB3]MDD0854099.1 outer membrane protein assembly factor BamA [Halobacteriovorax sp. GB3]